MAGAGEQLSGEVLGEVSSRLTAEFARYGGRGPHEARTFLLGHDVLVSVLRGGLTALEHTLVEDGREEVVRHVREQFQDALDETLATMVRDVTGREVTEYHSMVLPRNEVLVEVFMLAV